MVFLTEMGDLRRFSNRQQIGAYLGLVPSSDETGQRDDRKGHITRQGSPRIRQVLCQAAWGRVRHHQQEKAFYKKLVAKDPKAKKVAIVACMRRLGIRLWHRGLAAQASVERAAPSRRPQGGKRQFTLPAKPRKYRRRSSVEEEHRHAV